MIYDFTKEKSAMYFSTLLNVEYDFVLEEFVLSQNEWEYDEIGFYKKSKKNGLTRIGIFLPEYQNLRYKQNPSLHIFNCTTTDDLSRRMKETTTSTNSYYSTDTRKMVTATLEICKKCLRNLRKRHNIRLQINSFNNFVLELEESSKRQTLTDRSGYILNWKQVSYCFRENKSFTCEKCSYKADNDYEKKFLHSHHLDMNKKNNTRSNLQCLCVTCHSEVDEHHKQKFELEGLMQLKEFLEYKQKSNTKI